MNSRFTLIHIILNLTCAASALISKCEINSKLLTEERVLFALEQVTGNGLSDVNPTTRACVCMSCCVIAAPHACVWTSPGFYNRNQCWKLRGYRVHLS